MQMLVDAGAAMRSFTGDPSDFYVAIKGRTYLDLFDREAALAFYVSMPKASTPSKPCPRQTTPAAWHIRLPNFSCQLEGLSRRLQHLTDGKRQ